MTGAPWQRIELLTDNHDLSELITGRESVDRWLKNNALAEQGGRMSTHVCLSGEDAPVAFFALKHIPVSLDGASNTLRKMDEGDGATTGLLLAQMGVRQDLQGNRVGSRVIGEVMRCAARLHAEAAFRLLVVDAADSSLIGYYRKFGFEPIRGDRRLVMKMSAVRRVVEQHG